MCITTCPQCKRDLRFIPHLDWGDKPNSLVCTDCELKTLDMIISEASLKMFLEFKKYPFVHGTDVRTDENNLPHILVFVDEYCSVSDLNLIPNIYEGFRVIPEFTGPFSFY